MPSQKYCILTKRKQQIICLNFKVARPFNQLLDAQRVSYLAIYKEKRQHYCGQWQLDEEAKRLHANGPPLEFPARTLGCSETCSDIVGPILSSFIPCLNSPNPKTELVWGQVTLNLVWKNLLAIVVQTCLRITKSLL